MSINYRCKIKRLTINKNRSEYIEKVLTLIRGISEKSFVSLKVFDVLGNEIIKLINQVKEPGYYKVKINATALPSGMYFYNLQTDYYSETKKMLLLK